MVAKETERGIEAQGASLQIIHFSHREPIDLKGKAGEVARLLIGNRTDKEEIAKTIYDRELHHPDQRKRFTSDQAVGLVPRLVRSMEKQLPTDYKVKRSTEKILTKEGERVKSYYEIVPANVSPDPTEPVKAPAVPKEHNVFHLDSFSRNEKTIINFALQHPDTCVQEMATIFGLRSEIVGNYLLSIVQKRTEIAEVVVPIEGFENLYQGAKGEADNVLEQYRKVAEEKRKSERHEKDNRGEARKGPEIKEKKPTVILSPKSEEELFQSAQLLKNGIGIFLTFPDYGKIKSGNMEVFAVAQSRALLLEALQEDKKQRYTTIVQYLDENPNISQLLWRYPETHDVVRMIIKDNTPEQSLSEISASGEYRGSLPSKRRGPRTPLPPIE